MSEIGMINEVEGYWKELFKGYPGKVPFWGKCLSPTVTYSRVQATVPFAEYPETRLKLKRAILHAWAATLSYHSGSDDIVVSEGPFSSPSKPRHLSRHSPSD
jgi:hypothetical protein